MKSSLLSLLFLGTIFLVVAEKQDDLLAKLLVREEKLEHVVEKLTDFIADNAPKNILPEIEAPKPEAPKTDKTTKDVEADVGNREDDRDERLSELVELERRIEGRLESDSEEDVNDVDADTLKQLESRPQNSPFWGGRRRRRLFRAIGRFVRRTVNTVVSVVRKVVSGVIKIYGQYKYYSECLKNAAALAQAAGDEEEYQRLSVQADEAERMEADERIKKDMEEKGKQENDAAGEKATLLRKRRSLEADINLAEIEDEVENDIKAKLMNKQEKSDAKPWWGRRRRRRRTASTVIKNVCKWINAYSKYVLVAIQVAG